MMDDYKFSVNSNEYLPLREVVFNTLRDAILKGHIKPGERLMENHLADKLGVSRTPIREALRMLEIENLVELVPRKGAQVLDLSAKDIRDVLEIRSSMEALGVRLACEKMSDDQLVELKRLNEDFEKAFEIKDYEMIATADEKFHDLIFLSTENKRLIQIISNLRIQVYRYRIAYLKVTGFQNAAVEHHRLIIDAIEARDTAAGVNAATEHVDYQTNVILNSLSK